MFRRFCFYWDTIESFHSPPLFSARYTSALSRFHSIHISSISVPRHLRSPFLSLPPFLPTGRFSLPSAPSSRLRLLVLPRTVLSSCSALSTLLSTTTFYPSRGRGDTPRFTEAYVPSSSCFSPSRDQLSPWFFLVPPCVPPHNYRNDSVNSCALLPRPSWPLSVFLSGQALT